MENDDCQKHKQVPGFTIHEAGHCVRGDPLITPIAEVQKVDADRALAELGDERAAPFELHCTHQTPDPLHLRPINPGLDGFLRRITLIN